MQVPDQPSSRYSVTAEIVSAIAANRELEGVLAAVVERTARALGVSECVMYDYSSEEASVTARLRWGIETTPADESYVGKVVTLTEWPALQRVIHGGEAVEVRISDPELSAYDAVEMARWGEKSCLYAPLAIGETVIGFLELIESRYDRPFSEADRRFAGTLAALSAVAIRNARDQRLLEEQNQALRASEDRYRTLTESSEDAIFVHDRDGRFEFANRAFIGMVQQPLEDIVGKTLEDLFPPEIALSQREHMRTVLETRQPESREISVAWPTGTRWMDATLVPVKDDRDEVSVVIGVARDITRRKRAQEQIAKSSRLKEMLLGRASYEQKATMITDGLVDIFGADFARLWITREGDLCDRGCPHAAVTEGPHICHDRTRCLHLVASSGRYTHIDGGHRRVPFGCYKIGRVATGDDPMFLTNDVTSDPRVHDHDWARSLGLVSFAGFRLLGADGIPVGVLALFRKHAIVPDEAALMGDLANVASWVIVTGRAEAALGASEARYRTLTESSQDAIFVTDRDGRIQFANGAGAAWLRCPLDQIVGRAMQDIFPPEAAGEQQELLRRVLETKQPQRTQADLTLPAGRVCSDVTLVPVTDDRGEVVAVLGVARDITELMQAEEALAAEKAFTDTIIDGAPGILHILDSQGRLVRWNQEFQRLSGLPAEALEGMNAFEFVDEEDRDRVAGKIAEAFDAGTLEVEARVKTAAGPRGYLLNLRRMDAGGSSFLVGFGIDVTDREHAEEALRDAHGALERSHREVVELAARDPLTGLPNRRRFEEELGRALAEAVRLDRSGALLWLDIDHFKDVNDTLGHDAGDELLAQFGRILRGETRSYGVVARLGGDEFAVIIPAADDVEAMGAARRFLDELRGRTFTLAGRAMRISASVGVVLYPEHGVAAQDLLANADLAMYRAKESGRDRAVLYDPSEAWTTEAISRTMWGERIAVALAEDRFVLYAQPIRELTSGPAASYELLLRMVDDGGEVIDPLEFIPAAERLGVIADVDRWVARRAIRLLAEEEAAGQETHLSINVSGRTLSDSGFLDVVREELITTGADPRRLTVEVTEPAVVGDISKAASLARELHALGCRFSVDDFGTAASSLYYFKELQVDVLKIDGGLIKELGSGTVGTGLVGAIVEICGALDIASVAEYVDSRATLARVREAGVGYAQGFTIGEPQPLAAYLQSQGGPATAGEAGQTGPVAAK